MVAYSFKPQFVEPILAGTKLHTLRGPRQRHARPGEALQLYQGMRTKHCRLIAEKTCSQVINARLVFGLRPAVHLCQPTTPLDAVRIDDIDAFARSDGFDDFDAMERFFRETHNINARYDFAHIDRVLIGWGNPYPLTSSENKGHKSPH